MSRPPTPGCSYLQTAPDPTPPLGLEPPSAGRTDPRRAPPWLRRQRGPGSRGGEQQSTVTLEQSEATDGGQRENRPASGHEPGIRVAQTVHPHGWPLRHNGEKLTNQRAEGGDVSAFASFCTWIGCVKKRRSAPWRTRGGNTELQGTTELQPARYIQNCIYRSIEKSSISVHIRLLIFLK